MIGHAYRTFIDTMGRLAREKHVNVVECCPRFPWPPKWNPVHYVECLQSAGRTQVGHVSG